MKKVLTYGTFDTMHWGHINILKRAAELGDYLLVGISSDEFNEKKGKKSYHEFAIRKEMVESIVYVDKAIAENNWEQKIQDIIDYDIDIFVMGDDWIGKFDYLKEYCEVIYLPRTQSISSTQIKGILKNEE